MDETIRIVVQVGGDIPPVRPGARQGHVEIHEEGAPSGAGKSQCSLD